MQLFSKVKEPVILKESDTLYRQLHDAEEYAKTTAADIKPYIERDINLIKYGIQGEKNILYELKNSHMPMYVLHDICLEADGCEAQIDFLIITNKLVYVIECKNLYGNIEVDEKGDFVRTLPFGKRYQKEGIYSPVTQNERHIEVLKNLRLSAKSNILSKALFVKNFERNYRSVIVLANPKTYLNTRNAPKDIKNQIIRCDQLLRYIKEENRKSDRALSSEKEMKELAEFYLKEHKEKKTDYTEKYRNLEMEVGIRQDTTGCGPCTTKQKAEINGAGTAVDCEALREKLKDYRLKISREEGIKPYYIYNNLQMEKIIEMMPQTLEDLRKVNGIAEKKCEKYGEDILNIIKKYAQKG